MSKNPPWLQAAPPVDVTRLDKSELLDSWISNRNNLVGVMSADEMMKRLFVERKLNETKSS